MLRGLHGVRSSSALICYWADVCCGFLTPTADLANLRLHVRPLSARRPLCAMCRPGFGRRRSVDCVRCPSLATICFTYAVLLLFNIFGLTLALRTSLVQSRRHIGSFPPLMNQARDGAQPACTPQQTPDHLGQEILRLLGPNMTRVPFITSLTQVLKIALSFLMCTSLILRVQSSWPEDVANMLSLASLLGLTVDIVSVECVFGSNLFFERLLGYVLIIPAGALVTFLVAGIFFPFVRFRSRASLFLMSPVMRPGDPVSLSALSRLALRLRSSCSGARTTTSSTWSARSRSGAASRSSGRRRACSCPTEMFRRSSRRRAQATLS